MFRRRADEKSISEPSVIATRLAAKLSFKIPVRVVLSPLRLDTSSLEKSAQTETHSQEGLKSREGRQSSRFLNAELILNDNVLLCHGFGMGAAQLVFYAEVWHALGAREVVLVGTAGAIDPALEVGDLAVIKNAYRDEGVSQLYLEHDQRVQASRQLMARASTKATAKTSGRNLKFVDTWTTDAIFRETPSALEHFRQLGAQVVEMETSALYALAEHRGFEALALVVITDRLLANGWEFPRMSVKEPLNKLLQIAISG